MQVPAAGPVVVVGPGAIGLAVAARLHAAGTEVVLACRTKEAAADLGRRGIVAIGHDGSRVEARPPAVWRPEDLGAPARLLVVATKCAAAVEATRTWLPALRDEAPVVAVQNGVMGDELAAVAGDRLVECTVAFPATLESPGVSRQTGPGPFVVGPWPRPGPRDDPAQFKAVARLLADAAPVRASANMLGTKWTKLVINSCMTTLGAVSGHDFGSLLRHKAARDAFLAIVEEAHAAGRAEGVRFEPISGFRPGVFAAPLPGRTLLLAVLARKYKRHRSSSLQSLQRGQRTEVDWLNGHIVRAAHRHGLEAPVNRALVGMLHRIEQGDEHPSMAHVALAAAQRR
jgi:2-dehydropantoate 2-reductase